MKLKAGDLLNTSRSMERTYIDLLQQINENKKQWAIGPLHPVTIALVCTFILDNVSAESGENRKLHTIKGKETNTTMLYVTKLQWNTATLSLKYFNFCLGWWTDPC